MDYKTYIGFMRRAYTKDGIDYDKLTKKEFKKYLEEIKKRCTK